MYFSMSGVRYGCTTWWEVGIRVRVRVRVRVRRVRVRLHHVFG